MRPPNTLQRGNIYLGKNKPKTPRSIFYLLMTSKPAQQGEAWMLKVVPMESPHFVLGCSRNRNFYNLDANQIIYPGIRHSVITYGAAPVPLSIFQNTFDSNSITTINKQIVDDIAACVISHDHISEENEKYLW